MNQKQYNKLEESLKSEKKRFANAVIKRAREAGLNPKNVLHRLAIRKIAEIDYEIVMTLLLSDFED